MEITWLGHACFRLRGAHTTVITDPYPPGLGYSLGKPTARIVTISHQHPGHSYLQGVGGEPKAITRVGEYEINDVLVIGVPTFHDNQGGKSKGKNIAYLIEVDEAVVCHLGDLGHVLTDQQVGELENIDVLLLPVGGVSTINATTAAEVVRQIEPKIVIPMHYKTPISTRQLEPVEGFLKEMGVKEVNYQPKLTVSKANLPESTQVVLLSY